jgi:arginine/lysine/histidine/glutamine transport system substrate-binding/permease protein
MIAALQAGTVDAAVAGMTITADRAKVVDFSKPYIKAGLAIAVQENNKDITKFDNLKTKKLLCKSAQQVPTKRKKLPEPKLPRLILQT